MWTATLGKAGWTTGYVTDNPHLLLPVHTRFRAKFDRVELVRGAGAGAASAAAAVPRGASSTHYLPKALRGTNAERADGELPGAEPARPRRGGLQRGEGLPRRRWAGSSGRARAGSRSRS